MSNFSIETSSGMIQTGDLGGVNGGAASNFKVEREMKAEGMHVPAPSPGATTFSETLRQSMDQVNLDQQQADHSIKELVAGRSKNIHETMLSIEKADTSLKMMMQVRNKVLDAYKEIMRMQV